MTTIVHYRYEIKKSRYNSSKVLPSHFRSYWKSTFTHNSCFFDPLPLFGFVFGLYFIQRFHEPKSLALSNFLTIFHSSLLLFTAKHWNVLSDFSTIGASFLALYEFYIIFHPSLLGNDTSFSENQLWKNKMRKCCCGMSLQILNRVFLN